MDAQYRSVASLRNNLKECKLLIYFKQNWFFIHLCSFLKENFWCKIYKKKTLWDLNKYGYIFKNYSFISKAFMWQKQGTLVLEHFLYRKYLKKKLATNSFFIDLAIQCLKSKGNDLKKCKVRTWLAFIIYFK